MVNLLYFGIGTADGIARYGVFDPVVVTSFGQSVRSSIGSIFDVGFVIFVLCSGVFIVQRIISYFLDR